MTDNIVLGIKVQADDKDAKASLSGLESSLNKVAESGKKASSSVESVTSSVTRLGSASSATQAAANGLGRVSGAAQTAQKSMADMSGAWAKFSAAGALELGAIQGAASLTAKLKEAEAAAAAANNKLAGMKAGGSQLAEIAAMAGKATAGLSLMAAAVKSFGILREFDGLNASLKTVTGSYENAAVAMGMLRKFATETPYELNDVTQAFIRLKSLGLDASAASLRSYGNTASAMNKPIMQMIEAVADASTNEFERLKEFGIKAKQETDTVTFTFQGVSTTVQKNAADISRYLLGLGNTKFAGGMQDQMKTLGGAVSNLSDAFSNLVVTVGNVGMLEALKKGFAGATEFLNQFNDTINSVFGNSIAAQVEQTRVALEHARNELDNMMAVRRTPVIGDAPLIGISDAQLADQEHKVHSLEELLNGLLNQQRALSGQSATAMRAVTAGATEAASATSSLANSLNASGQALVDAAMKAWRVKDSRREVVEQIVATAEKSGFDPALLLSIAKTESSFNRLAASTSSTARGVFQFVAGTRARFGLRDPFNVEQSTIAAIKYLRALEGQFDDTRTAVAAYYSGEGTIQANGNVPDAKGADYARTVSKNMDALNAALGVAGKSWDTYSSHVNEANKAFARLKLHQDDQIKTAEDAAKTQSAAIRTSIAVLNAEEAAQKRARDAEIAAAKTQDDRLRIMAQAAQESDAYHASQTSLVMAEIDQQRKLLEVKKAALQAELAGATSGQYHQDESAQLAIKQAIRSVDSDLVQLAQARSQAEVNAGAAVNEYQQRSISLRSAEEASLQHLTAEYAKQQGILAKLREAAANGATADELANLNNMLQSLPDLSVYSQENLNKATQLNQGIAETANQIKNLQTVDQKFAEEQLRLNAAFEDGVKQAQLFATHATEAFGKAGEGIGRMAVGIAQFFQQSYQVDRDLGNELTKVTELFNRGQIDGTERVKRELEARDKAATKSAQYQIGLFGDITSAAQGYFKEGSKGYAALQNASKVFRAFEMAMALKSMATQIIGTETLLASDTVRTGAEVANSAARGQAKAAEAVANEASGGDPYSAFPRAAMMAAMMAALGFAVAGAMASGSAPGGYAEQQKIQGTGSVLGDSKAQSTSIEDSLAKIRDNSSNDLNYSAAMLTALQNIETALAGASAQIFTDVVPSIMGAISRSGISFQKNQWGPFEYTQKSITDAGILTVKQSLNTILKKGFEGLEYADITKKFNTLFGSSYSTKEYTQKLGQSTADQFTIVIRNMVDALKAGGDAFGLTAADVTARLRKFQVDMGKISLQGLSGDDAKKAISAVFGKLYDGMADALKVGLGKFKQVGEGSATTFFRVAEGANRARGELAQLGVTMISLQDVAKKRGQIDIELFLQSYQASGKASAELSQYIDRIKGTASSAQDAREALQKFIDVQNLLATAGVSNAALAGNDKGQSTLIDRVGGLDNLLSLLQDFNDNFLTESQRTAGSLATLSKGFSDFGVAMPASKDAFYQLIMGIDQSTEAGKALFGALLQLEGGFAKAQDVIQGIKDKYSDILNPFGKYGAQIDAVTGDFNTLITEAAKRSTSTLDALKTNLDTELAAKNKALGEDQSALASMNRDLDANRKKLADAQSVYDSEMAKKPGKRNTKKLNQAIKDINEAETAISTLSGFIDTTTTEIAGYQKAIEKLNTDYAGATGAEKAKADMEKAGIVADANKVMTDTLGQIFEDLAQTIQTAQQKVDAVVQFQTDMQTQIASLQGPSATAALMGQRRDAAMSAIDGYIDQVRAGMERNTDTELSLLQTAKGAVMDKYNAELAAVQQLQQNIQQLDSFAAGLATQIAQLQGTGAVAGLAGQRYSQAWSGINTYISGIQAGGTRDYAQEATLLQDAQTAIMDKYNAEMALLQEAAQRQGEAIQAGLQTQIDAINTATQSHVDAINTRLESDIVAIQAASDAAVEARQKEFDAANKLQQKEFDAANKLQQKAFDAANKLQEKANQKELDAIRKAQGVKMDALRSELDAANQVKDAIARVADYAKSLSLSSNSPLSPSDRLAEAGRQYQSTLSLAQAGDLTALGNLSQIADAYLQAARDYYGSSSPYADIFAGVKAAMDQVGAMKAADPDSIQARIDALTEAQTAELDRVQELQQDAMDLLREQQADQLEAARERQADLLDTLRSQQQKQLDALRKQAQDQEEIARKLAQSQIDAVQKASQANIEALQKNVAQRIADLSDPNKNAAMRALKDATVKDLEELARLTELSRAGAAAAAQIAQGKADAYRTQALADLNRIALLSEKVREQTVLQLTMTREQAKQAANNAVTQATVQLGKLQSGNALSAAQAGILNAIAKKLDPAFSPVPIPAYAAGGYASPGLALVGEKGPEIVRFNRPAQVLNAKDTRSALGDDGESKQLLRDIKTEAKASVTVQSAAFQALLDKIDRLEGKLAAMERNQRRGNEQSPVIRKQTA